MVIATDTAKVLANGNDAATVFSFSPVVINQSSDLLVVKTDAAGVETTLSEGATSTTYSVSVSSFPGTGSITYPASGGTPLATGETVTMKRKVDLLQSYDLEPQGGYHADLQEQAFDYAMMVAIQQQEEINRSLRLPLSDPIPVLNELPHATVRANKYLAFDEDGQSIALSGTSADVDISDRFVKATGSTTPRVVGDRFAEKANVFDFIPAAQHAAILAGTTTYDASGDVQDAIDAIEARGGGIVDVPWPLIGLGGGLRIKGSGVYIRGGGAGFMTNSSPYNQQASTVFRALAGFPAATPMLTIAPDTAAAHTCHSDIVEGVQLDCDEKAAEGISIISTRATRLRGVSIFFPTSIGLNVEVYDAADWSGSNKATKHFEFDGILARVANAARGIVLDGSDDGINVNMGEMRNYYVQHDSGVGIDLYDCDANLFTNGITWTDGSGDGMVFNGSSTAGKGSARGNTALGLQCTTGGLHFKAGTTQNAINNTVLAYSAGNATPAPVFEAGARNIVVRDRNWQITDDNGPELTFWHTDDLAGGSFAGAVHATGPNASSTLKTWARLRSRVLDATDGSEDAQWDIDTIVAGALARRGYIAQGLVMGGPAAGDLGVGTGDFEGMVRADGGFRFPTYTAANIADISHAVNTSGKVQGLGIWDLNNQRIMVANGSTAAATWHVADGSASVTPA